METIQKKRKIAKLFISGCLALMLSITTLTALMNVDKSTADGGGETLNPNPYTVTQVSAGGNHTLAIVDGKLYAWGLNDKGQLGLGDTTQRNVPTRVGTESNWQTVTGGSSHTLAINTAGELYAWGNNASGQLGLGDTTQRTEPTRVGTAADWENVYTLSTSALALNIKGELWAWGNNAAGQLGLGDITDRHDPTRVGDKSDWITISAGSNHSTAINTAGELWEWGGTNSKWVPTRVGVASNWAIVTAGSGFSLAINTIGELYSWGKYNSFGGLGLGDTSTPDVPTRVGAETNWAAVSAGYYDSLAINSFGELYAWGRNLGGCLGFTGGENIYIPTRLVTATNWTTVSISKSSSFVHSLVIGSDGELYAWGYNGYGQLGLGTSSAIYEYKVPTIVFGSNVAAPTNITGITFSAPSATRVKYGGSYTFTATLAPNYTSPIIQLTATGKTIAKIALTSMNKNVYTYTVYDVQADITASHFTRAVSKIV